MMAVGTWRAIWLLSRLRLQRLGNLLVTRKIGRKPDSPARAATPAKRRGGLLLALFLAAMMSFSFVNIGRQSVVNLECQLASASACAATDGHRVRDADALAARALKASGYSPPVVRALGLQLSMLLVVSILLPLGSREFTGAEWDLEWLTTLPMRRTTLLAARLGERSIANPTGLLAIMSPSLMIAWYAGYRWSAPLVAVGGAAALLPIAAVARTIVDTGLRMSLPASKLRNLQALCGVACLPFMYLAMAFGMPQAVSITGRLAALAPGWLLETPAGLLVVAITAATPAQAMLAAGKLALQLLACVVVGLLVLRYQLRHGVVGGGVRESGRTARAASAEAASASPWRRLLPRSPIQRRELRLLSRDRNFLVQSLLMPVVMVGSQMLLNGKLASLATLGADPTTLGLIAFGISAYMLMMSAFQTINSEGQVLWMLYTFPASLENILRDKARLWAVLALVYPVLLFGFGLATAPRLDWRMAGVIAIVLAGIPLYSVIAVALGVFASDPLSQDARAKLRPTQVYLYMLLASLYAYAIYAEAWWQAVVVMVLTAGLAQAFWQKARDALPYLLDPGAAPPAQVSTADGMIVVMLFFVLQGVAALFMVHVLKMDREGAVVLGYALAGIVVYALTRFSYWRSKTRGVPVLLAGDPARALELGMAVGVGAAALGLAYLLLLHRSPWWEAHLHQATGAQIKAPWMFLLAVVAAPLCEEFIFRGLLFGGLRRSLSFLPAAALSAALFAIVHPAVSIVPVFALGMCAAFAYDRSKGLLAPMVVHAIYNGAVLAAQLTT